ncbi:MAG: TIM barrel protein [bacterium]|nr:TIM barrel protein [bacterium]
MHTHRRVSVWVVLGLLCIASVGAWAADAPFGWRVGPAAWTFRQFSFFEAVDKTASIGMTCIEAFENQQVRPDVETKLNADLSDEEIEKIRAKLKEAKVTLTSIYIHTIPGDEATCRRIFEFATKLGVGFIVSEPAPEALDVIERHCNEFAIDLAIHNHPEGKSRYWHPDEVMKVCEGRGPRIGACADTGHWLRSGLDPSEGIRRLGARLISLHLKDLDKAAADATDRPWGQGCGNLGDVLKTVHELRLTPGLFTIEYESNWDNNLPQIQECGKWFVNASTALAAEASRDDPLYVGWATADITPPEPIALAGQYNKRLSKGVRDPLTATVLALETRGPDGTTEQAVIVSCDIISLSRTVHESLRKAIAARVPGLDVRKVLVSGTHTHTAPLTGKHPRYEVGNEPGEMEPSDYADFLCDRVAQAVLEAWEKRAPGGMSWALGHAAVGINRRAQFADGKTVMYGKSYKEGFRSLEGGSDPGVEMIFFWKPDKTISGVVINVACPSQETEHLYEVSADFWHDVRKELRARHGDGLFILPQGAAGGDQSPHRMIRKKAEEAMIKRRGVTYRQEIARRIADAYDAVLPVADQDIKFALPLVHDRVDVDLPEGDPVEPATTYDSVHPIQVHVIRIGDVAMASNPFELYLDYGLRIKARCREPFLTLIVQLADGKCGYLPTAKGVGGGGYSALKFLVGPEGGQVLVDKTVHHVNYLWP